MKLRKLSEGMFAIEGRTNRIVFEKGVCVVGNARPVSSEGCDEPAIEAAAFDAPHPSEGQPSVTVLEARLSSQKPEVKIDRADFGQP